MEYKETAEYAFDLLEHEYHAQLDLIRLVGEENLLLLVPQKLQRNLEAMTHTYIYNEVKICVPTSFRGVRIIYTNTEKPTFILNKQNK